MADGLYDEAIVDIVGPDTMVSEPYVIKVRTSRNSFDKPADDHKGSSPE